MKKTRSTVILIAVFIICFVITPAFAECLICSNETICLGATKAEVLNTCGKPLLITQESRLSSRETWTYIISGCYRYLYFIGNDLQSIQDGTTAR